MASGLVQFLAVIGFLFLGSKVFSFVRLLFSLFLLPGVSVSDVCYSMLGLATMIRIN